jgi:hypothetical protein
MPSRENRSFDALRHDSRGTVSMVVHGLSGFALACVGFGIGVVIIDFLDSPDLSGVAQQKLSHFLARKDAYNVAFVGNSHVYRQLDPVHFDATTASRGYSTRSYNLGVPAHTFFEISYQLQQIVEQNPSTLEWVILDVTFPWSIDQFNLGTQRFVAWHDVAQTVAALEYTFASNRVGTNADLINDKIRWSNRHLEAFFTRTTRRGRGFAIVEALKRPRHPAPRSNPSLGNGYVALEDSPSDAHRRGDFLEFVEGFEERVRAGTFPEVLAMTRYESSLVQSLVDTLEARGLRVMLICGPVVGSVELFRPVSQSPGVHGPYVYDSVRFPRLFGSDRRFDRGHLNRLGAREYTGDVAADFIELLDADER